MQESQPIRYYIYGNAVIIYVINYTCALPVDLMKQSLLMTSCYKFFETIFPTFTLYEWFFRGIQYFTIKMPRFEK